MTPEQKEQYIQESQHLAGLLDSQGWKVIESEIQERLNGDGKQRPGLLKMLVQSNDIEQIRDLQANIRSLELLLAFPRQMVEAAQKATEEEGLKAD
jgi:murein L,D-transpeptidase YcbB/YkuD